MRTVGRPNPADYPLAAAAPVHLSEHSAWLEHTPFAMFLIELLRPRLVVELGVQCGVSYCAFCQAIKALNLPTRCYGVDTWQGDIHTGSYGANILAKLRTAHDPHYASFSTLLQCSFDEALPRFQDGTVDLLHIDGCHTYDAVVHDFTTWLPKMSSAGVVLFHDTNVRDQESFGVWRFWEELKTRHATFEFEHGHGLGVLAAGTNLPPDCAALMQLNGAERTAFQEFFHRLGQRISAELALRQQLAGREQHIQHLQHELSRRDQHIQHLQHELTRRDQRVQNLQHELERLRLDTDNTINRMRRSWTWRVGRAVVAPVASLRRAG